MVRFVSASARVRVPATSANVGPGFDALGLALTLYDEVSAVVTGSGVRVAVTGEGADDLPTDERHLVVRAMNAAFDRLGGRPPGLDVSCRNAIPQARGLGSSSAAIAAGILLARALVVDGPAILDDRAVLALAAELEGHPDNVAPCLLGGFTIAWTGADGARAVRLVPHAAIRPVLFVPAQQGLTAQARAALPATVPHRDAAFNAGRAALLVHAVTAAPELLFAATEDRLHQGYRAPGMPATAQLVDKLRTESIAAVVSGAGPSVLALLQSDQQVCVEPGWAMHTLTVDADGAYCEIDWQHADTDPVAAG
ncbi:MAG TPA: homoserine kinase [Micromonosporaceae bacterium]